MIDPTVVQEFLAQRRIALVGASDDPKSFGRTVHCALRDHGHDVVAVNPNYEAVAGDRCYPDLAGVTGDIDGVVVMVQRDGGGRRAGSRIARASGPSALYGSRLVVVQ